MHNWARQLLPTDILPHSEDAPPWHDMMGCRRTNWRNRSRQTAATEQQVPNNSRYYLSDRHLYLTIAPQCGAWQATHARVTPPWEPWRGASTLRRSNHSHSQKSWVMPSANNQTKLAVPAHPQSIVFPLYC